MKSSTVIIRCLFVFTIATLPFTINAAPMSPSASSNQNGINVSNMYPSSSSSEGGQQFQFAQYGPYQQQQKQQQQRLQKKWSRLEPSIRFFKRSFLPQQQFQPTNNNNNNEFANRYMFL
uniref:Uncharacterized protein n=1 Tax=Panagrolaimus superbus TaxID=310955 RepID=A0A914ZCQ7_9BILA